MTAKREVAVSAPSTVPVRQPTPVRRPEPVQQPGQHPVPARSLRRMFDERVTRLRSASATTPGRFGLIGVGLVLLIALVGLLTAVGVAQRTAAMNHLVGASEPRATAALQVHGALSDADAMASRAFLSSEQEPLEVRQKVRQRYEDAIARAQTSLAVAARGAADETAGPITELATQLPVYVGLVETARANSRQGFPVGAAYLRDASSLMRERLLPAARQLREIEARNQQADVDAANGFPYDLVLLGLVLLVGLVAAQLYLFRRTNRRLNIGLLAATGAVVVWSLWLVIAVSNQVGGIEDSVRRGSAQTDVLAAASVKAREAKAAETLTLVLRGGKPEVDPFTKPISELGDAGGGLLAQARRLVTDAPVGSEVDSAIENVQAWRQVHDDLRKHDDVGQYKEAVDLAILPEDRSADSVFNRLEVNLDQGYKHAEQAFKEEATAARNATSGLVAGIVVLTIVALAGSAWGMWQRFREYL
jgi:hypothetical protein